MAYTGVRTLAVMVNSLQRRRASAVLFSLITACLLGLGGLLVGMSLWRHFGPPAKDPDDTDAYLFGLLVGGLLAICGIDRKSTRLNSSHRYISYAVFCLKKKKNNLSLGDHHFDKDDRLVHVGLMHNHLIVAVVRSLLLLDLGIATLIKDSLIRRI